MQTYILQNNVLKATFLPLGAAIDQLWVPDKHGNAANILIGHKSIEDRIENNNCQGEIAGRVCNRIGGAKFELNGVVYCLTQNSDGPYMLHGAKEFNTAIWDAKQVSDNIIEFRYTSPDGMHGFPGELKACVRYALQENALLIEFEATTNKDTIVNLTNHAYFNLAGQGQIFDHMLQIDAEHYLPLSEALVPTGEIAAVEGTRFDFRQARRIGEDYDINFCNPKAMQAWDEISGRRMTVKSDLPGVQLYTGECLAEPYTGFCLETQLWPDAPNHPHFPSIVLRAEETWRSWTKFSFDVM